MSDPTELLTAADRHVLDARGIPEDEARRQIALLRDPPPPTRLDRPATARDGIRVLEGHEQDTYVARGEEAIADGRITKFVPASGAATRMFKTLLPLLDEDPFPDRATLETRAADGDAGARDLVHLANGLDLLPFLESLDAALQVAGAGPAAACIRRGELRPILAEILEGDAHGFVARPKGLIPFHRGPTGPRTPLEEHLREAAVMARGSDGLCRVHLTVSPEHERGFESLVEVLRGPLGEELGARFEVTTSFQDPATDTLALDADGGLVREGSGALHFRPGGHGALITNLHRLGGDLVVLKNIDNVVPEPRRPLLLRWKKILTGLLVELEREVHGAIRNLEEGTTDASVLEGVRALTERLGHTGGLPTGGDADALRIALLDRLRRPIRVCGMVRNVGEPGGGPFWVRGPDDVSLQIVETSQIDTADAAQAGLLGKATHFNPVDVVASLRDPHGAGYDLPAFVDPNAAFVTRKSREGREILALERPGLWNGAMAGWSTVFVEVPLETFAPVKTINDLLRPEHQG